jgi:hypothetical protein
VKTRQQAGLIRRALTGGLISIVASCRLLPAGRG